MTDQNTALLIGLGTGVITLLGAVTPLLFKFLSTQQEIKRDLAHNTKVTVEAADKIDVANDITGKLLRSNDNIAKTMQVAEKNSKDIAGLQLGRAENARDITELQHGREDNAQAISDLQKSVE